MVQTKETGSLEEVAKRKREGLLIAWLHIPAGSHTALT